MEMTERRTAKGLPTPWWDRRPTFPDDLGWVWRAWQELSTCRTYHMGGPGPIPWDAVDRYCQRYGHTLDEQEELLGYLRALDGEMLKREG